MTTKKQRRAAVAARTAARNAAEKADNLRKLKEAQQRREARREQEEFEGARIRRRNERTNPGIFGNRVLSTTHGSNMSYEEALAILEPDKPVDSYMERSRAGAYDA